ncbi:uncharacterized protein LOC141693618 isoform X1 [Apium graveolens]|uniref:uncharacterized protein LOC141693618 isoform X1 n=1 Tax=Apium graveolens TaxID=4045 RepID=UPI003D7A4D9B
MGSCSFLKNKYWVLRHGKSIPNDKGIIVSSMVLLYIHENGVLEEYKLAPEGINQARLAGQMFLQELKQDQLSIKDVRICYSPFSRTRHTAEMVASVLDLPFEGPQCKVVKDLHERYFGPSYELMSHDKYADVWALDEKDPFEPPEGGESVADVVSRLANALLTIETEFQGCAVLVVSHGDPLQILQTMLNAAKDDEGWDSNDLTSRIQAVKVPSVISQHRKFALLTGELRAVI